MLVVGQFMGDESSRKVVREAMNKLSMEQEENQKNQDGFYLKQLALWLYNNDKFLTSNKLKFDEKQLISHKKLMHIK